MVTGGIEVEKVNTAGSPCDAARRSARRTLPPSLSSVRPPHTRTDRRDHTTTTDDGDDDDGDDDEGTLLLPVATWRRRVVAAAAVVVVVDGCN